MSDPVVPAPITDAEAINVAKQALLEPGTDIDVNQIDVAVRAAGGLVWRRDDAGRVEIAMIHRPSYDDWTFPKGKRDPGETTKECALREVLEETGLVCELGIELTRTAYIDRKGRPKSVRYWTMTVRRLGAVRAGRRGRRGGVGAGPRDPLAAHLRPRPRGARLVPRTDRTTSAPTGSELDLRSQRRRFRRRSPCRSSGHRSGDTQVPYG